MSYGEPEDVTGQCNARLFIADNFGDNHATMRCQLEPTHDGLHREQYDAQRGGPVVVTWEKDARRKCDHCDQWEHAHDYDNCPRHADGHDVEACTICKASED